MFVVYQDGKRCSEYKIPTWDVDSFETKREAEEFAYRWAYPVSKEDAKIYAEPMDLGVEYDYSMFDGHVMMKIEEI